MSVAPPSSESTTPNHDDLLTTTLLQAEKIQKLEQQNELYRFELEQLKQYIYGRRSEKEFGAPVEQGRLFGGEEPPPPAKDSDELDIAAHKRKRKSKKEIPADLPIDEVVYHPEQTHCECGEKLKEFSRDVRKELEFQPARFFMRHHITVNCTCSKCNVVASGEVPPENKPVIPGAQVGPGFLGQILMSKFSDHIPYYRQSQIYERNGVFIPDKNLSRYGIICGELLEPVAKLIKQELLKLEYLQADETRLEVLDRDKSPNTHTGQLWVLNDPLSSLTYYEYHKGRDKGAGASLLGAYTGSLQTDAYVGYDDYTGVRLGCMGHARRYFVKAKKLAPKECNHVIRLMGKLYKVEKDAKQHSLYKKKNKREEWFEHRYKLRQEHSVKVLVELREYLVRIKDKWLLEEHPLCKAIHYMLSRYYMFCAYATDGRFEIDNNDIERTIRPIAIGRRNWLFSGSHHGAKMSAILFTIVQCCKKMKINPQQYLADVLPRLADHNTTSLKGLAPFDWKTNTA